MMKKLIPVVFIVLTPFHAWGASDTDIDAMTTMATMYGRAIGCGIASDDLGKEIGRWFDRHFPRGTQQATYMPIFTMGVKQNAKAQHNGESPDSCSKVSEFFQSNEYKQTIAQ